MKKAVLWVLAVACSQMVAVGAAAQATKLKFAVFTPDKEQTFVTVMKPFADAVRLGTSRSPCASRSTCRSPTRR